MRIVYKLILFISCLFIFCISAFSQIGYQVSLLNTSTGEPRANVSVKAGITITDADNGIVFSGDQFATTNDFGVLSLTVGDSDTFSNVDWNKLPFYISVTVDDVLIGRSQILNVPVAEYAKQSGSVLTKEMLMGRKWIADYTDSGHYSAITFYEDYLCYEVINYDAGEDEFTSYKYQYLIEDGKILFWRDKKHIRFYTYSFLHNVIIDNAYFRTYISF